VSIAPARTGQITADEDHPLDREDPASAAAWDALKLMIVQEAA
jgi:hypothetical protein